MSYLVIHDVRLRVLDGQIERYKQSAQVIAAMDDFLRDVFDWI